MVFSLFSSDSNPHHHSIIVFLILLVMNHSKSSTASFSVIKNNMHILPLPKLPNLILLDRDGVINRDIGAPGVLKPAQLDLTFGAAHAIGNLRRAGCKVALITNQSSVGKELITQSELDLIHDKLQHLLQEQDEDAVLDAIYSCTSLRTSGDPRMKPNPGMIYEACQAFDIQPSDSVFIGDTMKDLQAAASAAVPLRMLVETGYGLSVMNGQRAPSEDNVVTEIDQNYCENLKVPIIGIENDGVSVLPFFYVRDLHTAVAWILNGNTNSNSMETANTISFRG